MLKPTHLTTIAILALGAILGPHNALGDVIVAYESSNGADIQPSHTGLGVVGNVVERGAGTSQSGGTLFTTSGFANGTLGQAVALDDYIEWGFVGTQALDLTDIDIAYSRAHEGPSEISLQLNANNAGFVQVFSDTAVNFGLADVNLDIDLSAFQSITSAVFRLYGFDANSQGGTFVLENSAQIESSPGVFDGTIAVNGVVSTPEPSSMAIWSFGLAIAVRFRGRRGTVTG